MNPALAYLRKRGAIHKLAIPCQVIGDDPSITIPFLAALNGQPSSNIFTRCRVAIREKTPAGFAKLIFENWRPDQRATSI